MLYSPPVRVEMEIDGPTQQRRLTVSLRALLLIPHYLVLAFLRTTAVMVGIVAWFAALVTGRCPKWARSFLAEYMLPYSMQVGAYGYLLVDRYPPLSVDDGNYPARLDLPPSEKLNRATVAARLILAIPAVIVCLGLMAGWNACAVVVWASVLVTGRTPTPIFGATASLLRYRTQLAAYMLLITDVYPNPDALLGAAIVDPNQQRVPHGTRPLIMTRGAVALLAFFLVAGVVAYVTQQAQTDLLVNLALEMRR